jgi:hypothetical protein
MNGLCRRLAASVLLTALALGGSAGVAAASETPIGISLSPAGVLSGNLIQIPTGIPTVPIFCGNSVNVIGLLNPASGNTCIPNGTS